jgi:hypothetical protein
VLQGSRIKDLTTEGTEAQSDFLASCSANAIPSEAVFQAERGISLGCLGGAREIPRPAGEGAGLRDDASNEKPRSEKIHNFGNMGNAGRHDFANLLPVTSTSGLVNDYLRFRASLHTHFTFRSNWKRRHIDNYNLCSIFKRSPAFIHLELNGARVIKRVSEISCPKLLANNQHYAMFIDDVDFVNGPKNISDRSFTQVRSLVGLQLLDKCKCIGGDQMFEPFFRFFEIGLADANRKVGGIAAGNIVSVQDCQLANQMIQGGPKVVDDIAYNKRPIRVVGSYLPVPNNHTVPLRLVIEDEKISTWFRRAPSVDSTLQFRELVIRTLQLIPNSGEMGAHGP